MQHVVASEGIATNRSHVLGAGIPPDRIMRTPTGLAHAVVPGASHTLCGLEVAGLALFDEHPWTSEALERCERCLAAAPVS